MKKNIIAIELSRISKKNKGVLKPEDVVSEAKRKSSPLHSLFTWDDTKAGHQYRLWQARQIIRTTVVYEERVDREIRTYVSLSSDRDSEGGGYREIVTVLKNETRRTEMLEDALAELNLFKAKYGSLVELCGIFDEMQKLEQLV